ncbi:MAG: DUF1549 domain-containing protein [Pirellulales bacterium]
MNKPIAPRHLPPRAQTVVVGFLAAAVALMAHFVAASDIGSKDDSPDPVKKTAIVRRGGSSYGIEQVARINDFIRRGWADHKLSPSPKASDFEWCRRVYLDIHGRIPTVPELDRFLQDRSPNQRLNLVNRLLGEGPVNDEDDRKLNEAYAERYARHFTTVWSNILIGRTGGNERRDMTSREGLQTYLRTSLLANKPYNQMVVELVSAQGVNEPGQENYNGAVNFLAGKLDEDAVQATAKTAQIFLGLQVQCTQCHNHPFNDWKQSQFWQLNAFFRQTRARRTSAERGRAAVELYNADFDGQSTSQDVEGKDEAWIFYELRNGSVGGALPVFVDGAAIDPSGRVSKIDRRSELARLIAGSEHMPTVMVNRMWAHFMGYGFTKPIDDMGPHNPPSHPELLERLAADFQGNGFSVKDLIRWIVLSEPYSLSARSTRYNERDDPSLGEKPQFSKFYLRQITAEQLFESLIVATEADKTQASFTEQERAKAEWLRQFTIAFGTDDGGETTTFNGTIPQVLMMFNGELIRRATNGDQGSFLEQVANKRDLGYEDKVHYLFLSALSRKANAGEMRFSEGTLLAAYKGDQLKALQDVFWVLLNSNEFLLNH